MFDNATQPVPTDPLGNPLPSAGPEALSAQPDEGEEGNLPMPPVSGGATMGLMSPTLARLHQNMNANARATANRPPQPGDWARNIIASVPSAISGLSDSLSDAAAATAPVPPGGGALTGVARTLAAGRQRQSEEKEAVSKEKTAELLRAETTQRIASDMRNRYREDQEHRNQAYARDSKFMSDFRKKYNTTEDQDNITQDQLNELVKDKDFWKTHTGRAVGEEPVMVGGKQAVDKNGQPVFSPLYSISKNDGTQRTSPLSEAEAKFIQDNTGDKVTPGTELTFDQHDNAMVRASAAYDSKKKVEKANDEEMSAEQARQLSVVMNDPRIQHYMGMNPGEPLAGLYSAQKNVQSHVSAIDQMIQSVQQKVPSQPGQINPTVQALQQKKQEFLQEGQNVDKAISGFNEKAKDDYIKRQDEQRKQAEVERHDKAEEFNKQMEIKAKKGDFLGDENAATPEAFRASLDPASRATIDLIGTGKAPLNNPGYLLAKKPEILNAVTRAYPDFEPDKIKSYQENYTKYTSGKTGDQLKSGAIALKHLKEAFDLNTNASHIPGTPAYVAYKNKVDTLSTELAGFYGDSTVPGIANIKETLMSTLPGNRGSAIKTQAQSMMDRLDTLKDAWDESAPSKQYAAQMPTYLATMVARKDALATITGQQPQQTQQVPVGARPIIKNGQTVGYIDAAGKRTNF